MFVLPRPLLLTLALTLLASGLAGCAGTVTPPTRYQLPDTASATQTGDAASKPLATLEISQLRLAHYLDVDGIIMQMDDIKLREAREHQWAEGLDQQLARSLQSNLAGELPQWRVTRGRSGDDSALSLRINIDQFQGRYDGYALISGQWQLRDAQNKLISMDGFRARTALEDDGYPALVRALGQSLASASEDIAAAIQRGVL